jgi:hypothetical protein
MIIYDLVCDFNHSFEGWFKNADDMQVQQANGLLTCPVCDSDQVSKNKISRMWVIVSQRKRLVFTVAKKMPVIFVGLRVQSK